MQKVIDLTLFSPLSWQRNIVWISCNWLFLLLMTRGRIWDRHMFQPNWSIFEFYPHITFDLGFHGQNAVWKNSRHVCLVGRTFLCILIHEFPNTNKMATGFWSETYRLTTHNSLQISVSQTMIDWYQNKLRVSPATSGNVVIQVQHGFSLKKNRMMQHWAQKLTTKF